MEIEAIIATIVAAVIGALLAPWWTRKLQAKREPPKTTPSDAAGIGECDSSKLPVSAQDPAIRDAVHQFFIREHGRAPSHKELHDILNSIFVETGTITPTKEEVDRAMEHIRQEDVRGNDSA